MPTTLTSLDQITAAIDRLDPDQKAKLFESLRAKLLTEGVLPPPRLYSKAEIDSWVAADEADMRRLQERP